MHAASTSYDQKGARHDYRGHRTRTAVRALAEADGQGIVGAAVTPFVLGRIAAATAGRSIPANLALAEGNAAVAAEIAVAVAASHPRR